MGSPLSVTRSLDSYIELVEEPREPDGKYHPSQFWLCARQTVYAVRGVKGEQPDAPSKRRFKIGHALHEIVQAALSFSPDVEVAYNEFSVEILEWNITGHGDSLLMIRLANGEVVWIVVEIKSIRKAGLYRVRKEGREKEDHRGQASIYAVGAHDFGVEVIDRETGEKLFIPPLGDALKGVLFVYFEKEDLDTEEFFVEYDADAKGKIVPGSWAAAIADRVAELEPFRLDESGESLPPRLPMSKGKRHWACGYCPFETQCWSKDGMLLAAGDTEPAEVEHW